MSTTTNLGLNKHDSVTTNEDEFDIDTYLNANWDKIDAKYVEATTEAAGLMSASSVTKLNGIATGATNVIVDTSLSDTSTNAIENSAVTTAINTINTNGVIGATQYGGTIISASEDLNNITKSGFYTCYATTANAPSTSYSWFIIHENSNAGVVTAVQTAKAYSTTLIIMYRTKIGSTWGSWINFNVYTDTDKTKLSGVETGATKTTIANNLTTATAGSALDATQGKILNDKTTYYTTEHAIGKWIDNRTIYRKVVTVTPTTASTTYSHEITNLNAVLNVNGFYLKDTNVSQPIQRVVTDALSSYGIGIGDFTSSTFLLQLGSSLPLNKTAYIVLEYIKTS